MKFVLETILLLKVDLEGFLNQCKIEYLYHSRELSVIDSGVITYPVCYSLI